MLAIQKITRDEKKYPQMMTEQHQVLFVFHRYLIADSGARDTVPRQGEDPDARPRPARPARSQAARQQRGEEGLAARPRCHGAAPAQGRVRRLTSRSFRQFHTQATFNATENNDIL